MCFVVKNYHSFHCFAVKAFPFIVGNTNVYQSFNVIVNSIVFPLTHFKSINPIFFPLQMVQNNEVLRLGTFIFEFKIGISIRFVSQILTFQLFFILDVQVSRIMYQRTDNSILFCMDDNYSIRIIVRLQFLLAKVHDNVVLNYFIYHGKNIAFVIPCM